MYNISLYKSPLTCDNGVQLQPMLVPFSCR